LLLAVVSPAGTVAGIEDEDLLGVGPGANPIRVPRGSPPALSSRS
jgi:hypothetical protein